MKEVTMHLYCNCGHEKTVIWDLDKFKDKVQELQQSTWCSECNSQWMYGTESIFTDPKEFQMSPTDLEMVDHMNVPVGSVNGQMDIAVQNGKIYIQNKRDIIYTNGRLPNGAISYRIGRD